MFLSKLNNKKILIVENDISSSQLLFEFFASSKAHIIHARNGNEAISILKKNKDIDIILMDIKLPQKSGIWATKEIRRFNQNIPIIAQTASVLAQEIEQYKISGMNDFISKPYRQQEILNIVQKHI